MGKELERITKDTVSLMSLGATNYASKTLNPDLPKPDEPDVAPVADDEATKRAARRKASMRSRAGRAGTMLTEESTLG